MDRRGCRRRAPPRAGRARGVSGSGPPVVVDGDLRAACVPPRASRSAGARALRSPRALPTRRQTRCSPDAGSAIGRDAAGRPSQPSARAREARVPAQRRACPSSPSAAQRASHAARGTARAGDRRSARAPRRTHVPVAARADARSSAGAGASHPATAARRTPIERRRGPRRPASVPAAGWRCWHSGGRASAPSGSRRGRLGPSARPRRRRPAPASTLRRQSRASRSGSVAARRGVAVMSRAPRQRGGRPRPAVAVRAGRTRRRVRTAVPVRTGVGRWTCPGRAIVTACCVTLLGASESSAGILMQRVDHRHPEEAGARRDAGDVEATRQPSVSSRRCRQQPAGDALVGARCRPAACAVRVAQAVAPKPVTDHEPTTVCSGRAAS